MVGSQVPTNGSRDRHTDVAVGGRGAPCLGCEVMPALIQLCLLEISLPCLGPLSAPRPSSIPGCVECPEHFPPASQDPQPLRASLCRELLEAPRPPPEPHLPHAGSWTQVRRSLPPESACLAWGHLRGLSWGLGGVGGRRACPVECFLLWKNHSAKSPGEDPNPLCVLGHTIPEALLSVSTSAEWV